MSLRTIIGLCIWPSLFLLAFAVSLRLLPIRPLMTVALPGQRAYANPSPDAALLMTQSTDGGHTRVRFWRVPTGEEDTSMPLPPRSFIEFLHDGRLLFQRLFSGSVDRCQLTFTELSTGKEWLTVGSSDWFDNCLSRDGSTLAVTSTDSERHQIEVWDVMRRCKTATLVAGSPVALSPDGRILLYQAESPPELVFLDLAHRRELGRIETSDPTPTGWVVFSPNGKLVAVRCKAPQGEKFQVIDVGTFRTLATSEFIHTFAFALDGEVLFTIGSGETQIHHWDLETGHEGDIRLPGSDFGFGLFQISPDGRLLAVETVVLRRPLPAYIDYLLPWQWLLTLCAGGQDELSTVLVFDARTKRLLESFTKRHMSPYPFSSDGSHLALVSQDGSAEVWQIPPRKPVWLAASLAVVAIAAVWVVPFAYRRLRFVRRLQQTSVALNASP